MPGRHLAPDHSKGDANSIGGYASVHGRPAAFEGSDGYSYSVAIEVDETGDATRPFGAFLLFVRWRRVGEQGVEGHLETEFVEYGASAALARERLNRWQLNDVKRALDECIVQRSSSPDARRWWDVMRDDDSSSES